MAATAQVIDLGYRARRQFHPFHARKQRWACLVAHRRAGKTVACIADLVDAALRCDKPSARFAYVAPFFVQAKDVAWGYLKRFTAPIPGVSFNEAELRVDLPGDRRIRLYGADNYDRMRGLYLDGCILDEYGDWPPSAWSEVIRPALSDRQGWAVFIGTPKGRNGFWEVYNRAEQSEEWFSLMLKASETGLLPPEELEGIRAELTEDQFRQEMECSFDAAVIGSYYGRLLDAAQEAGRITSVPYEPAARVETWWDLGVGDSTAIWFAQQVGRELRVIDHYEMTGEGLAHYAKILDQKGYLYSRHIGPHDLRVRELGSGRSRLEIAEGLGIRFEIAPEIGVDDGINAARLLLPKCWFDATKCAKGIEALRQYRKAYDEKLRTFRDRPLHDWTSHTADAFRYGAVAYKEQTERAAPRRPVARSNAWMG